MGRETKADKVASAAHDVFTRTMAHAFKGHFGEEIETEWSIMAGRMVSRRLDDQPFSEAQAAFLAGFEQAWAEAVGVCYVAAL